MLERVNKLFTMHFCRYVYAPYGISITNVNAGPVQTAFVDRYGVLELGGKGTREVVDDSGYLDYISERFLTLFRK